MEGSKAFPVANEALSFARFSLISASRNIKAYDHRISCTLIQRIIPILMVDMQELYLPFGIDNPASGELVSAGGCSVSQSTTVWECGRSIQSWLYIR